MSWISISGIASRYSVKWKQETPPYQLAVNFLLVDCNPENGPLEMAPSTHMLTKEEALRRIDSGRDIFATSSNEARRCAYS